MSSTIAAAAAAATETLLSIPLASPIPEAAALANAAAKASAAAVAAAQASASAAATAAYIASLPHDSKGPLLLIFSTVITAITVLIVLLRLWARTVIIRSFGPEDWAIIPATILSISMCAFTIDSVLHNGTGKHMYLLTDTQRTGVLKNIFTGNLHYVILLAFTKASMLLQLLRIAAPKSRTRKVIIGVFSVAIVFSVVNFLISLFNCTPIRYQWTRATDPTGGKCLGVKTVGYTTSILHIVMDLAIWITPMPLVWRLKLPVAQKVGLAVVFSLGGVACIAACARFASVVDFVTHPAKVKDSSYTQIPAVLWSVVEANVCIICACLPTLRPLLKSCLPSVFGTQAASRRTGPSYYGDGSGGISKGSKGGSQLRSYGDKSEAFEKVSYEMKTKAQGGGDGYGSSTEELARGMGIRVEVGIEVREENGRRLGERRLSGGSEQAVKGMVPGRGVPPGMAV